MTQNTGDEPRRPQPARGPLGRLIDLFSSIPLGVTLLVLLFVYSSIGSAGLWYPVNARFWSLSEGWAQLHVRQLRGFEMTEFEWFHWWPFDLLMGLISLNIIVATLRRIPFKPLNYGVWTIHAGILAMSAGCVWYFGTKLEGDAPVVRRQVRIEIPSGEVGFLTAVPGTTLELGPLGDRWTFRVSSINREWPLLSGDDAGTKVFQVNVMASGGGELFIRQLHTGFPQYDEDMIRSDDPAQPFARSVKVTGDKLVRPDVEMELVYEPQEWMYLAHHIEKAWAIYLREVGARDWVERPVDGLPMYQDYVASGSDVWFDGALPPKPDPLDVVVPPVASDDPLPGVPLRITSYLRYAQMRTQWVAGGERLNPVAQATLSAPGFPDERFELVAADEVRSFSDNQLIQLRWAGSEAERDALGNTDNVLEIEVPSSGFRDTVRITPESTARLNGELEFTEIPGTPYSYRIDTLQNGLEISGRRVSVAFVDIRNADGDREALQRWVFDDGNLTRDVADEDPGAGANGQHDMAPGLIDDGIVMRYRPAAPVLAPVTLVAGPGDDELHALVYRNEGEPEWSRVTVGQDLDLSGQGELLLRVDSLLTHARAETRPRIVPPTQRERDAKVQLSMVKVELASAGATVTEWVPYHHYPIREPNETLRRFPYAPRLVTLPDGRRVEMILSRQRRPLPEQVALHDFDLVTHVGGFNESVSSIRDWISQVTFSDDDGATWTDPMPVQMNKPAEHAGLWYFQAQWDPPSGPRFQGDVPSQGLNYTVLGIANRNGVTLMLLGATVAVLGMIYAFYIKPVIRRRIRDRALASAAAAAGKNAA